jgi:proteasome lid subunit RPN8/RPN11
MDMNRHSELPAEDENSPATAPPEVPVDRDVSQVNPADYPQRDLLRIRDQRRKGFQTVFARSALNDMHRHGRSERDVEVCGVLVGSVYHDENGAYLYIEASIKGDHAAGKSAQVTFTSETWNHINDEMERNFADRKILGWYHTHPGFGIFLSEMDLFIQNNFFPEPWQVAYVYDPKSEEDGVFVWKRGQATRDKYLVDPNTINTDPPRGKEPPAVTSASGPVPELTDRVQSLERKVRWLIAALFLVLALAVAAPIAVQLYLPTLLRLGTTDHDDGADAEGEKLNIPPSLQPPPQSLQPPPPSTQPATDISR